MNTELKSLIQTLKDIDAQNADYGDIVQLIGRIFDNQRSLSNILEPRSAFYRFRECTSYQPSRIEEFREREPKNITGFQRCNSPGHPMFYSSNRILTAALETRVEVGQTLYMSQWLLHRPLRVDLTMILDHSKRENISSELHLDPINLELLDLFDTYFTQPISKTFADRYKITSAIAEQRIFIKFPDDEDRVNISSSGHIGLAYKSVVDGKDGHNLALHPSIVNEFCNLNQVTEVRVLSRCEDDLTLGITDYSKKFKDGEVVWSNDPNSCPIASIISEQNPYYEGIRWKVSSS